MNNYPDERNASVIFIKNHFIKNYISLKIPLFLLKIQKLLAFLIEPKKVLLKKQETFGQCIKIFIMLIYLNFVGIDIFSCLDLHICQFHLLTDDFSQSFLVHNHA